MKTTFILGQRMTSDLVYELFQPLLPFLDEIVIKYSIVSSKRKLPQKCFPRERGNYHLALSFQFTSKPLKVTVSSSNSRFLQLEDRKICLDPDLVGGEAAPADPHGLRVAHVDLEEVAGRPVGVIQVLRLGDEPPGVRYGLRHFAIAAAAAGSSPPPPPSAKAAAAAAAARRGDSRLARSAANRGERARRTGGRSLHAKLRPRLLRLPPFAQGETADWPLRRARFAGPAAAPEGHCGVGLRPGGVTGRWAPRIRGDYNDHNALGERAAAD